jgi:hypothetical protein
VVVIGGGCYGSFYAGQLAQARLRGRIEFRSVLVVDRDPQCQAVRESRIGVGFQSVVSEWGSFLDRFLDHPAPAPDLPGDAIVPSPLMPHLLAEWLERLAGRIAPSRLVTRTVAALPFGTPYDVLAPDGTRYVSFADWLCPTHCIEPHVCPVIRAPRTWEIREALVDYTARLDRVRPTAGPAVFLTRHRAFGVGMFDVAEVREARAALERALTDPPMDLVVGTVSACHGAVTVLRVDRGSEAPSDR